MEEDGGLIWLASYPKSGNTWLRCLLEAYNTNRPIDINNLRVAFGDSYRSLYQGVTSLDVTKLSEPEVYLLRPAALINGMAHHHPPRFIKTHFGNQYGSELPPFIPPQLTKCAIYIVRDPRSVALSWSNHLGKTMEKTISMMANRSASIHGGSEGDEQCIVHLGSWSTHVGSWTEPERKYPVLVLKYEDMVEDTAKALSDIIDLVGWNYDEARVNRAIRTASLKSLRKQEGEKGFKEKSKYADRFFSNGGTRWQDELSPKHIRQIEKDHRKLMKKFGYL